MITIAFAVLHSQIIFNIVKSTSLINIINIIAWLQPKVICLLYVTLSVKTKLKSFFFFDLLFSTKYHPAFGKEHSVKM